MNNTNVGVITDQKDINVSTQPIDNCLKGTSNFTSTIYQNVCTGQSYEVPNGSLDILAIFVLGGMGLALLAVFGGIARVIIRD